MSSNKKDSVRESKAQTGKATKEALPVKNASTDQVKNTASQTVGLNQSKTKRDDLLPSDGDNLTQ